MEAPNRKVIGNLFDRYQSLKLRESFSKSLQYVLACKELSLILKNGYSNFPKNLQSLVFQDVLFAFNILPEISAQSAISAANSLLRSAEFALPKQKRALAVKQHKHAVVASKRKAKATHESKGCLIVLPHDILVHIFSSLDVLSIVSASSVCRLWNVAALDNQLWKSLYTTRFCDNRIITWNPRLKIHGVTRSDETVRLPVSISMGDGIDWRSAYITAYKEMYHRRRFKSNRGYCLSCHSIIWLCSSDCCNKHNHQLKPVSTQQVVEYIQDALVLSESSSSESESDDGEDASILKLWAYPRQIN